VRSEEANEEKFFQELARRQVGPLAIKPVTLKFLLKRFGKRNELPSTQSELYAEGCEYLCEESNQSRIDSALKGALSINRRVRVAQRIAAISVFANRSAVWMGLQSELPAGDVGINELAFGTEKVADQRFEIGENEVRETLGTGLFNSRGSHRMGWAHQTYAEFLAAKFLADHDVPLNQRLALISDADMKIVPQLHETAAWLAGMDREVLLHIMKN
jgi:predicted NACHT family NTPase